MKLGMPQLYEFNTIEENFKLASELGLDFVELNLNFGYCRKALEDGSVEPLLKKYNLSATLHFYDEADFGSYPEVVDAYMLLLERYAKLGEGFIESLNIHLLPGPVVTISGVKNYIYEKEFDEYIQNFKANLKRAMAILDTYHIKMVIENTDNIPSFMCRVYKELHQEGFRFCYDIGHDHLSGDLLLKLIDEIPLAFDEFHFHDGKNRSKCHLELGTGQMDLKRYKDLAIQQNAWVNLEVKQKSDLLTSVPYFKSL